MDKFGSPYARNHNGSFNYRKLDHDSLRSTNGGDFSFGGENDRRFAFSRQSSFQQATPASPSPHTPLSLSSNDLSKPFLSRTVSSIDIPPNVYSHLKDTKDDLFSASSAISLIYRGVRSGNKQMRKVFLLISLNVAYSTAELCIGLLSGRVGLVSDAFHLTFGCGLLTFSLFAMAFSRRKPDGLYTYGYKRLEVLSAFTNALFLLFMSFSLAVEALHAFIQDESEHKHYMIVSAVTNLLVNLIGVWLFRNYARINLGLILASWLLAVGVNNAEVLCLGLVSVTVFMLVMPLFKATGGILLQMAPPTIPSSALSKCWRQVTSREDLTELSQARFWEVVPGQAIGSISLQLKRGMDDRGILHYVHDLYHELGVQDLTVQIDHT